jgi:hypothetical protein
MLGIALVYSSEGQGIEYTHVQEREYTKNFMRNTIIEKS